MWLFDGYGTLIDWEGGVGAFLYALALQHEDQPEGNGRAMRERWEAIEAGLVEGAY